MYTHAHIHHIHTYVIYAYTQTYAYIYTTYQASIIYALFISSLSTIYSLIVGIQLTYGYSRKSPSDLHVASTPITRPVSLTNPRLCDLIRDTSLNMHVCRCIYIHLYAYACVCACAKKLCVEIV